MGQAHILSVPITSLDLVFVTSGPLLSGSSTLHHPKSLLETIERQALHLSLGTVAPCLFRLVTGYAFPMGCQLILDLPEQLCAQRSLKNHRGAPDLVQRVMTKSRKRSIATINLQN